jgi:hypothetical protein
MINALELEKAEGDALRGLQAGTDNLDTDDPVWAELADLGLVTRRIGGWLLTMRGRLYGTDSRDNGRRNAGCVAPLGSAAC